MAITYTSTLQPQYARERLDFVDMYGRKTILYIMASQISNRQALIDAQTQAMQEVETATTAMMNALQPSGGS